MSALTLLLENASRVIGQHSASSYAVHASTVYTVYKNNPALRRYLENYTRLRPGNCDKARNHRAIPDLHSHDMRHPFATQLVSRGVDLYKVHRPLGHKTRIMRQRYAHRSPESVSAGVNVLDRPQPRRVSTHLAERPRFKYFAGTTE